MWFLVNITCWKRKCPSSLHRASHTPHTPQDQTPLAYGSHILMNAGGKEKCRKAHTGSAQNGPYRLSLRPQSFTKTKGGISFIFSKPSTQAIFEEQWHPNTTCENFNRVSCALKHLLLTVDVRRMSSNFLCWGLWSLHCVSVHYFLTISTPCRTARHSVLTRNETSPVPSAGLWWSCSWFE